MRTSLAVGFATDDLPKEFVRCRGRVHRAIPLTDEFPFEDGQFEVVLLEGAAVSLKSVREAHRMLKPEGRLCFVVPECTKKQAGYTLPEIYSIVREGFNIVRAQRSAWWFFRARGRTFAITAAKKAWRPYRGLARAGGLALSPFRT